MAHRNRWFTWVYLLKMVISHGYVSHNQMVTIPGMLTFNGGMVWHWLPGMMPWRLPGRWTAIAFRPACFEAQPAELIHPVHPSFQAFKAVIQPGQGHGQSPMYIQRWFGFDLSQVISYFSMDTGHFQLKVMNSHQLPSSSHGQKSFDVPFIEVSLDLLCLLWID